LRSKLPVTAERPAGEQHSTGVLPFSRGWRSDRRAQDRLMAVRIVRLGTRRGRGEGLRIGTVRRPPRGVPKTEYASKNWYDVWLPELAPSERIIRLAQRGDPASWRSFDRRFTAELKRPPARRLLELLARLSRRANFSVGCYCADESRCHRSILRRELRAHGAEVK
jgi:uncharacterized protein YeaO (DUF488 family)